MHFCMKITLCVLLNLIVNQHKTQYYITLIHFVKHLKYRFSVFKKNFQSCAVRALKVIS